MEIRYRQLRQRNRYKGKYRARRTPPPLSVIVGQHTRVSPPNDRGFAWKLGRPKV